MMSQEEVFRNDRLINVRKKNNLTQNEVANYIGVQRTTYTRYEKGGIVPPTDIVVKLASFFKISTDYLLGKSDTPNPYPNMIVNQINSGESINLSDLPKDAQDKVIEYYQLMREKYAKEISEQQTVKNKALEEKKIRKNNILYVAEDNNENSETNNSISAHSPIVDKSTLNKLYPNRKKDR